MKMKYEFNWAGGSEIVNGKSVQDACHNIKASPNRIITGWLVRVRKVFPRMERHTKKERAWMYWDAKMFWKHLKID